MISRVDVPVLAVAGRHSTLWPVESSRWIAENAPRGRYAELDGGHTPFLDCPEEFGWLLRDWRR